MFLPSARPALQRIVQRQYTAKRATLSFLIVIGVFFCIAPQAAHAANKYWIGSAGGNISDDANWSTTLGSACGINNNTTTPGPSDVAVFTSSCTNSASLNATISLQGLDMRPGYGGTITQASAAKLTIGTGDFKIAAGVYDSGSNTVDINDALTATGGTFAATSSGMFVSGHVTITTTFTENSGTVTFDGGASTLDVSASETFYNVVISKTSGASFTVASGDTMVVSNALTLTDGLFVTGTINAEGTISVGAGFDGGSGRLNFADDAEAQTISAPSGTILPNMYFDSAGDANDSIVMSGNISMTGLNITSGFSGSVPVTYNNNSLTIGTSGFTQDAGTFTAPATLTMQGGFTKTAGTFVEGTGTVSFTNFNATYNVDVREEFYNVTVAKSNSFTFTITSGDTLVVANTLTLTDGIVASGTFDARGNVSVASTYDGGTAPLAFSGSAVQTFNLTGATGTFNGDITVNKTGGKVQLLSALVMDAASQDLALTRGTFDIYGNTLTVNGTSGQFTAASGAMLRLLGSETITANTGYPRLNTGSTVFYALSTGTQAIKDYIYSDLIISSTGSAVYTLPAATLDVNRNLTISGGTLRITNGQNITLSGSWLKTSNGTFTAGTGTVTLNGHNQTMSGSTSFYNFTKSTGVPATLTFAATATQTVTNTLTLNGAASNLLSLRSSRTGTQWRIDPQGTRAASYLDVKDGYSIHVTKVNCTNNCTNSGNNTNFLFFFSLIQGTVYNDGGVTTLGTGRLVTASLNGGAKAGSGFTIAGGTYSMTLTGATLTGGTIISLYLDGASEKAATVTLGSGSSMTGMDLYRDRLIVRSDSGSVALTNAHLAIADNIADSDLTSIYSVNGGILNVQQDKSLLVWTGKTFTPGGDVAVGSGVTVNGTLLPGANTITLSGSWLNAGTFTSGTSTVVFDGTTDQTVTTGSNRFYNITLNNSGGGTSDDILVGGTFNLSGALTVTLGNLDLTTNSVALVVEGGITVANAAQATVTTNSAVTASGSLSTGAAGSYILTNAPTLTLTGIDQTLDTNNVIFGSLVIASSSGTTLSGDHRVSSSFQINTGSTLALGTFTLAATGADIFNYARLYEDTGKVVHTATNFLIANGSYAETASFEAPATLYFTLTDADENSVGTAADTLTITVTTLEGDSETVTLTETSNTSGIFRGSIVSANAAVAAADTTLQAAAATTVTATFTDAQDALSNTDTASLTVAAAAGSSSSSSSSSAAAEPVRGGNRRHSDVPPVTRPATPPVQPDAFNPADCARHPLARPVMTRFTDVPARAWFASYINEIAHLGIVSGYKNEQGQDLNIFRPEGSITYAELAKILTLLTAKDTYRPYASPQDANARRHWSRAYIAHMEDIRNSVYLDRYRPDAPIARGNLIQALMEALGIPVSAQPVLFTDLSRSHPRYAAISTAFSLGIIHGDDRVNTVRPQDDINRAEVAKILNCVLDLGLVKQVKRIKKPELRIKLHKISYFLDSHSLILSQYSLSYSSPDSPETRSIISGHASNLALGPDSPTPRVIARVESSSSLKIP